MAFEHFLSPPTATTKILATPNESNKCQLGGHGRRMYKSQHLAREEVIGYV